MVLAAPHGGNLPNVVRDDMVSSFEDMNNFPPGMHLRPYQMVLPFSGDQRFHPQGSDQPSWDTHHRSQSFRYLPSTMYGKKMQVSSIPRIYYVRGQDEITMGVLQQDTSSEPPPPAKKPRRSGGVEPVSIQEKMLRLNPDAVKKDGASAARCERSAIAQPVQCSTGCEADALAAAGRAGHDVCDGAIWIWHAFRGHSRRSREIFKKASSWQSSEQQTEAKAKPSNEAALTGLTLTRRHRMKLKRDLLNASAVVPMWNFLARFMLVFTSTFTFTGERNQQNPNNVSRHTDKSQGRLKSTTSPGRPHSTLLEVTGAVPTVLSGRNIDFMLLSERGSQPASHVDDFAPGIFFTCYQGPVEIIPPNPYDIGADLPEEDERLDVHEMIDISILFRECDLQIFDEARVLEFWTDYGGRKSACGYDEAPGVDINLSDPDTSNAQGTWLLVGDTSGPNFRRYSVTYNTPDRREYNLETGAHLPHRDFPWAILYFCRQGTSPSELALTATTISPEEYLYTMLNAADKWNAYSPQLQAEIDAFVLWRPDKYFKENTELITTITVFCPEDMKHESCVATNKTQGAPTSRI
ncbi:hypothetical protein FPHYL_876 [Fusarium phyllophilum]|uniref:Uncharacterized protein n=1 Tax=Fusarium phyllophilum TaxID=47803 RepID=A0A8H5KAX5_9HYPO|nr:hypothetical protein FPHYL_876 [Fusarium phyllophilum]